MTKNSILKILALFMLVAIFAVPMTGCRSGRLAEGTYSLSRFYVDGVSLEVGSGPVWDVFHNVTWRVRGEYIFVSMPSMGWNDYQIRHRIRNGYLEQREMGRRTQWIRENGSSESMWTSTRVENGEIVIRVNMPGTPSIKLVFSLPCEDDCC